MVRNIQETIMDQAKTRLAATASARSTTQFIPTILSILLLGGFAVAVRFAFRLSDFRDRAEPVLPVAVSSHHNLSFSHARTNGADSVLIYLPFDRSFALAREAPEAFDLNRFTQVAHPERSRYEVAQGWHGFTGARHLPVQSFSRCGDA